MLRNLFVQLPAPKPRQTPNLVFFFFFNNIHIIIALKEIYQMFGMVQLRAGGFSLTLG